MGKDQLRETLLFLGVCLGNLSGDDPRLISSRECIRSAMKYVEEVLGRVGGSGPRRKIMDLLHRRRVIHLTPSESSLLPVNCDTVVKSIFPYKDNLFAHSENKNYNSILWPDETWEKVYKSIKDRLS